MLILAVLAANLVTVVDPIPIPSFPTLLAVLTAL